MTDATNNSENGHLSTRYWPATFEERGVVAPFTTPTLAFSRVRSDQRDGLEILIPGMSGGSGVYVIAWPSVREVFRMTVHDRALHEAIQDTKATTPRMMRRCANQTAMTGLAGPDSLECSKVALEQEENERLLTNFYLINSVVDRLSPTPASLTVAELSSPQGQRKARQILDQIADGLGASSEKIYRCLEVWSDLIAPLGLSMMPHECRLRRLMKRLEAFRMNAGEWNQRSNADPDGLSLLAADVAKLTLDVGYPVIAEVDAFASNLAETLTGWKKVEPVIQDRLDRLSWLLDGWEHVLTIWDSVLESAIWEQVEAMEEIVRMLPLVPKKELERHKGNAWGELETALRRFVKPLQNWQSGEVDIDLLLRVEHRRARAL
ncbi:hypothetical protein BAL199_20620 [alpha proteobacterium BAL199]|jgi:hypothetical protein|nr:hypothetical protein BAL199_20620 [alpha proteobacterium BAL199]